MLKCTLLSAVDKREETALEGIFVQAVTGELGILENHLPIIAQLKANSRLRLKTAAAPKYYTLGQNSFLYFQDNTALILTQSFAAV